MLHGSRSGRVWVGLWPGTWAWVLQRSSASEAAEATAHSGFWGRLLGYKVEESLPACAPLYHNIHRH